MRSRVTRLVWSALLVVLVVGLVPIGAGAQQVPQQQLAEAQQALDQLGRDIRRAERRAEDSEVALEDADETLRELEAIVNSVALEVERQRTAVRDAERRLVRVEEEVDELRALFADRVTRMHKQGADLVFEVMLSADSVEDAMARTALLARVAESEQVELEHLEAAEVALAAGQRRFEAEAELLETLLREQQELRDEAAELREHRALAAANARAELDDLHREHDDLEEEEAALQAMIERIEQEQRQAAQSRDQAAPGTSAAAASATASSSGFRWPACGPVTSEYGPRWGRQHRGIDLGLSSGTPVAASKDGTVVFAGSQGGYGNLVLIDHHDGVVTAYAHLSAFEVSVGQVVRQGTTIARSGNTGNSTGPHLHFETRANGTAVNPRQYLVGGPC